MTHNLKIYFTLFVFLTITNNNTFSQTSNSINSWEEKADSIITCAKSQLGVPYKWATSNAGVSFDCSGFTYYVYNSFKIKSSRGAAYYKNYGKPIPINECRKGDCILFTGTNPNVKSIGHIGIIIENKGDELFFIHCSSSTRHFGVVITEYFSSNYPKRFIETRRIFE